MENYKNNDYIKGLYKWLKRHNINNNDISIIKIDYVDYIRYEILIRETEYIRQFKNKNDLYDYLKNIIIPFKDYVLRESREEIC